MRFGEEALVVAPTLVTDAEEIAAAIAASLPELRRFMPWSHAPQTARSQLQRLLEVEADYFAAEIHGVRRPRKPGRGRPA